MSRAGYIPQLFSLRLPNPSVIFELLHKANAKALVYDTSYTSILPQHTLPTHLALSINQVDAMDEPLPKMPQIEHGNQTVFVLHTSGSTSGSPKLVPCSATWLNAIVNKSVHVGRPRDPQRQDVCVWMYVVFVSLVCYFSKLTFISGEACATLAKNSCYLAPFSTGLALSNQQKSLFLLMN